MLNISINKIRKATGIADVDVTPVGDQIDDNQLNLYIADAQIELEAETGMKFEPYIITEKHDGDGESSSLILDNYPIEYVVSLKIDGVDVESLGVTPTDPQKFAVYKDIGKITLKETGVIFTDGIANIEVQYSYYNVKLVEIAKSAIFYMTCIMALVDVGSYLSEGAKKEKFDKYTVDYSGGPYDGTIQKLQSKFEGCMRGLGRRISHDIIG